GVHVWHGDTSRLFCVGRIGETTTLQDISSSPRRPTVNTRSHLQPQTAWGSSGSDLPVPSSQQPAIASLLQHVVRSQQSDACSPAVSGASVRRDFAVSAKNRRSLSGSRNAAVSLPAGPFA